MIRTFMNSRTFMIRRRCTEDIQTTAVAAAAVVVVAVVAVAAAHSKQPKPELLLRQERELLHSTLLKDSEMDLTN